MINIKTVLNRVNSQWDLLMGIPAWNAIKSKDAGQNDIEKYADYTLLVCGAENLLRDKKKRDFLFRELYEDEANELLSLFGHKETEFPWKSLVNIVTRNNDREKILFEYFGVEYIERPPTEKKPDSEMLSGKHPLFTYQKNVLLRAMAQYRSDSTSNFLIHMPTGSGKTRVAMSFISRVLMESEKTVVLWLAYSEELCEQAVEEFRKSWESIGDRELSVQRLYQKYDSKPISDGLIVASLSKLWAKKKSVVTFIPRLSEKLSLVVFDEAHQSVAPTYLTMLKEIKIYNDKCCFVGLSATPGRAKEGETSLLSEFFDNIKITLTVPGYSSPIHFLYDEGFLSKPRFIELISNSSLKDITSMGDDDYTNELLNKLGSNFERNSLIANRVVEAVVEDGHKRTIVFAASVASAEYISALINLEGIESSVVSSVIDSDTRMDRIERFQSKEPMPMVLCNYGVLTTGFDSPQITLVVIARPTKSLILYSQMVGRALRGSKMGGGDNAEILTVVDTDITGFGSVIEAFKNWDSDWNEG